jgi:hypothetical protein
MIGEPGGGRPSRAGWLLAALGVALLAAAFRCLWLSTVPPGLYVDEVLTAKNALAWRLDPHAGLLGAHALLVPGWVETSNLYLAFASAVMALGGDALVGVRLLSVLPSLAAVPLLYLLGARVADRRAGILAAFLLACSHWAARSGRTGWDAVLMVTLQLGALVLLSEPTQRRRLLPAVVAGALLGLSLYTYLAARLALLQATLWLGWEVVAARRDGGGVDAQRNAGPGRAHALARLLVCCGLAVALAAPWLLRRQAATGGLVPPRVADLSVFAHHGPGEPWRTLGRNVAGHLLMFHLRGGAYARDALPGFPMLDPVTGLLLLAGLVVVSRLPGWRRRLLVSWPLVLVLGGVLSRSGEGPPYPYRVASLAPWACLVAALGGVALWERAGRARLPLATVALAAVVGINAWALFVAWPGDPGTRRIHGTAPTRLGLWLRAHAGGRPVLVLRGALRPSPLPSGYPYAKANRTDFFRDVDAAAAVQLSAGVWARHPRRALDPLAAGGDVDWAPELPARLPGGTLLVVPPELVAEAARRHRVERRVDLQHEDGAPRATVLWIAGRSGPP